MNESEAKHPQMRST